MLIKKLIEKVKNGDKLRKDERLRTLRYLLQREDKTTSELADLFGVSERTVLRDRKEIRQEISTELLDSYGLAGELFLQYRRTLSELKGIINETGEDMNVKRLALKDRWRAAYDFYRIVKDQELEKRIEVLEREVLESAQ